jgi:hypothetical protein
MPTPRAPAGSGAALATPGWSKTVIGLPGAEGGARSRTGTSGRGATGVSDGVPRIGMAPSSLAGVEYLTIQHVTIQHVAGYSK